MNSNPISNKTLVIRTKRYHYILTVLCTLTILAALLASQLGALPISFWQLIRHELDSNLIAIWIDIRLPRVLMALLIGSALALTGAVLQGLFRNPLADPGLLGISSGSALMVGIAILLLPFIPFNHLGLSEMLQHFIRQYLLVIAAFIGGMTVAFMLFLFSRNKRSTLIRLLLLGVAINAISGGAIGLFTYLSSDTQLRQFSLWTLGSLGGASFSILISASVIILPAGLYLLRFTHKLNLLQLGQEQAFYLGVNVKNTQWQLLLLCALIVGTAVAMTGIIGFVGLVIPHLLRLQFGADHRFLLPASVFGGGLFLLIADTLARTVIIPAEMPVGIITSLVGGPYFLYLILKMNHSDN